MKFRKGITPFLVLTGIFVSLLGVSISYGAGARGIDTLASYSFVFDLLSPGGWAIFCIACGVIVLIGAIIQNEFVAKVGVLLIIFLFGTWSSALWITFMTGRMVSWSGPLIFTNLTVVKAVVVGQDFTADEVIVKTANEDRFN